MWPFGNTRRAPRPNRRPREGSVAAFPYQNAPTFKSTRGFSCKRKGGPNSPFKNGYYASYNGNTEPPDGWIEKHCEASNNANEPRSRSKSGSVASDPGSLKHGETLKKLQGNVKRAENALRASATNHYHTRYSKNNINQQRRILEKAKKALAEY